jgi:hypothetical protein
MQDIEFIRTYPRLTPARCFAARLLRETRGQGEATEANIAWVAMECGCSDDEREEIIGASLDAGLVVPTVLPVVGAGTHVAALRRTSEKERTSHWCGSGSRTASAICSRRTLSATS